MTIYILQAYSTETEGGRFERKTIGVFTNKAKLVAAVKKHADLLDLDDCEGFRDACRDMFGQWGDMCEVGEYLDKGTILECDANKIYPDGI